MTGFEPAASRSQSARSTKLSYTPPSSPTPAGSRGGGSPGTREAFANEVILDEVAEAEEVTVDQGELIEYIIATSSEYGMDPNQFAMMLDQGGQIPMIMGEVRRRKALAKVLEYAEVTDTDGKAVDLTAFVTPGGQEALDAEAEGAEAEGADEAEEKPAEKAPAKKTTARKKA